MLSFFPSVSHLHFREMGNRKNARARFLTSSVSPSPSPFVAAVTRSLQISDLSLVVSEQSSFSGNSVFLSGYVAFNSLCSAPLTTFGGGVGPFLSFFLLLLLTLVR